ncbi:hypothetical protein RDWZM_004144, partial [Blomia tropicalis]
ADRPDRNRSKSDLTSSINARRVRRVKVFHEQRNRPNNNDRDQYTHTDTDMDRENRSS